MRSTKTQMTKNKLTLEELFRQETIGRRAD
jgi:hypothetical protein